MKPAPRSASTAKSGTTAERPQPKSPERADAGATGNQGLLVFLRAGDVRAKLAVSQPDDADERDADRVADDVLRGDRGAPAITAPAATGVQRMCTTCDEEQRVRRKVDAGAHTEARAAGQLVSGGGRALDPEDRRFFEVRMGADFGGVRVHTDARAAGAARQIGARAFTVGEDVSFAGGEFAPRSERGRHLIAHELAHVVQQRRSGGHVQRAAATDAAAVGAEAGTDAVGGPSPATPERAVLVDDDGTPGPDQMRRRDFVAALRTAVCATVEQALAGTRWSAAGCPYIERWLRRYETCDVGHFERVLRRYAGASAPTAAAYIPIICDRVRRSALEWARSGRVTGLPEGATPMPPAGGVQFKSSDGTPAVTEHPVTIRSQLGDGRPLDGTTRGRMEAAFGTAFSDVRVHTDGSAATLSSRYHARAFTLGSDVAFAADEYRPGQPVGDALIAHELAHVVQQRGSGGAPMSKGDGDSSPLERDADAAAIGAFSALYLGDRRAAAALGGRAQPLLRAGLRLQRCGSKSTSPPSPPAWGPPTGHTTTTIPEAVSPFGKFSIEHGLDPAPTGATVGSYYIKTEMTPNARTANAAAIGFQQVVRRGTSPTSMSKVASDPYMNATRATLTDPATGWATDQPFFSATFENTPYYALTKNPAGPGYVERPIVHQGKFGGDNPWIRDAPGVNDPHAVEFYTCAVCTLPTATTPSEKDRSYGCISWGFTHDSSTKTWNEETPTFSIQAAFGAQTGRAAGMEAGLTRWTTNVATPGSGIEGAVMPFQRGAAVKAKVKGGFVRLRTVDPVTGNLVRSATTLPPGTQFTVLQQRVERADHDGVTKPMTEVQSPAGDVVWVLWEDLTFTH